MPLPAFAMKVCDMPLSSLCFSGWEHCLFSLSTPAACDYHLSTSSYHTTTTTAAAASKTMIIQCDGLSSVNIPTKTCIDKLFLQGIRRAKVATTGGVGKAGANLFSTSVSQEDDMIAKRAKVR